MDSKEWSYPPAIKEAAEARKTAPAPSGMCSTQDLAEYYGICKEMVGRAAKNGEIPSAHKILDRWVFDFKVAVEGWKPAVVQRFEMGVPPVGGRKPRGPFAEGNTLALGGRGGRPTGAVQLRFLSALTAEVSTEDWVGIIRKAVDQALQGDYRARMWLSHYLIGKPVERILAKVDIGGERFSVAERAVAVEELLAHLVRQDNVIDGEAVSAEPDTTPG